MPVTHHATKQGWGQGSEPIVRQKEAEPKRQSPIMRQKEAEAMAVKHQLETVGSGVSKIS